MNKHNWKNPLMLFITALIWGTAFVAQSVGMDYVGPFTFNCIRNIVGGSVLIPCIWFLDRWKEKDQKENGERTQTSKDYKVLAVGGICCGTALCFASNTQQIAIQYTTVGKAGFITALYIVIVPIMGIFLKKKCGIQIWVSVCIAAVGFYLLSMTGSLHLERVDAWLLASAFLFSIHILVIDHFSPRVDGVKMSCIQFFVCGILSGVMMFLTEDATVPSILSAWKPILYSGVMSCGVAYTLQILGQKDYNPTVASLLLSLESVFSVLAGWVLLGQAMSGRELFGCFLIFCAIVLAQVPIKLRKQDPVHFLK